jgi:hypothetical protein
MTQLYEDLMNRRVRVTLYETQLDGEIVGLYVNPLCGSLSIMVLTDNGVLTEFRPYQVHFLKEQK